MKSALLHNTFKLSTALVSKNRPSFVFNSSAKCLVIAFETLNIFSSIYGVSSVSIPYCLIKLRSGSVGLQLKSQCVEISSLLTNSKHC